MAGWIIDPVGHRDSSRTRVQPVFDWLRERDATGRWWLKRLLALPSRPGLSAAPVDVGEPGDLLRFEYEARLAPPDSLLHWLIDNRIPDPPQDYGSRSKDTIRKRKSLWRDLASAKDAAHRELVSRGYRENEWYVFEGRTAVDLCLETRDLVVLIEGKRTEAGPTTSTTWMPVREQVLRNIDATWDGRGNRQVVAFYIVGEDASPGLPPIWETAVASAVSPTMLEHSLPHRSPTERAEIARGFLGATTWGQICAEFGINYASLPDTTS